MTLGKAFDISNWSGRLTADQVACIKREGYELVIPGTQIASISQQQFGVCAAGGLRLQAYVFLDFTGDAAAQVSAAIDICAGFPVEMLWLDCEDEKAEAMTEAATVAFIQAAADACINRMRSGIYAAEGWWKRQTGNSEAFKAYPLWNALYNGGADLVAAGYGGWGVPFIHQYSANVPICGVNTDLNVFQIAAPDPPLPQPQPPVVTRPRLEYVSTQEHWDDTAGLYIVESTYREAGA